MRLCVCIAADFELIPITATSFRYKSGISATVHFDPRDDGRVEAARIVFPDGGYERFARWIDTVGPAVAGELSRVTVDLTANRVIAHSRAIPPRASTCV